jgi:hypothetical protein
MAATLFPFTCRDCTTSSLNATLLVLSEHEIHGTHQPEAGPEISQVQGLHIQDREGHEDGVAQAQGRVSDPLQVPEVSYQVKASKRTQ